MKPELIHWHQGKEGEKDYVEGYSVKIKDEEVTVNISVRRLRVILDNLPYIKKVVKAYYKKP